MLSENIKTIRKAKGLSQEELAIELNVVRQTISKWEQGRSVPDADLLISLSETLGAPVSALLGETIVKAAPESTKALSEKLEAINLQLARAKETRRKALHWLFIALAATTAIALAALFLWGSPYLEWDFSDPETAVAGTAIHAFEFVFVRIAPIALVGAIVGAFETRRKC